ncbi:MAG TPA: preprotein translocase subunit YajC [Rhizomicrobium sp.]|nr:preprotein translocase subunit YajC [Rhizomicrobium sp.]
MSDPTLSMFLPLAMMFAIFYFLVWRPQSQRTKQLKQMINNLKRGDTVVTAGGMLGKVAKTGAEADTDLLVEVADNVEVRVLKSAITDVRTKSDAKA